MSDRFSQASRLAEELHRGQVRKGTTIPYVSHLYAVAGLLMEWGAQEDVVIAGLLHDAVEDCGGELTAALIRERFGDRVADVVLSCSDSVTDDPTVKASWSERKQAHVAEVAHMSDDAALVTAADKLHNLQTLNRDLRREGPATLQRFKAPDQMLWYYEAITQALKGRVPDEVLQELADQVGAFRTHNDTA